MKYKHVLYTDRLTEEIRTKLRIVKYDKKKSKKNNVYFVYFASEEDAKYAYKACKRMQNVTIKPFQSTLVPTNQTASSITVITKETSSSTIKTKTTKTTSPATIKLMKRFLPRNSPEIVPLFESINACLNAMNIVKCTFDEISQLRQEKHQINGPLFDRLFHEHSTASYLKIALAIQFKAMLSTNLRLVWSMIVPPVHIFQRHIYHEQIFLRDLQRKQIDLLLKRIDFQSSITMSSKLAYQLVKLTET